MDKFMTRHNMKEEIAKLDDAVTAILKVAWGSSPQGYGYWCDVYNHLVENRDRLHIKVRKQYQEIMEGYSDDE